MGWTYEEFIKKHRPMCELNGTTEDIRNEHIIKMLWGYKTHEIETLEALLIEACGLFWYLKDRKIVKLGEKASARVSMFLSKPEIKKLLEGVKSE